MVSRFVNSKGISDTLIISLDGFEGLLIFSLKSLPIYDEFGH